MSDAPNNSDKDTASEPIEVVEAEIIENTAETEPEHSARYQQKEQADPMPELKPVANSSAPKKGKAGWIVSGVLAAFIAGIFAAPYAEKQLIQLGLLTASGTRDETQQTVSFDSSALEAEMAELKASLTTYKTILAQQAEDIKAGEAARTDLQRSVELAAAAQPLAGVPNETPADIAALKADIERLTTDIARLGAISSESDPAVSQLKGALALAKAEAAQFKARLETVENNISAVQAGALEASPRGRLVLSLVRLKERALAGLDFSSELNALRTDIAALPAIDQQLIGAEFAVLEKHAKGISPYIALVRDYDAAVSGALKAGEKAEGSFLTNLFTSRRTDAGATGDDAVFLQTERRLAARDMEGALSALSGLSRPVAEAIKPWQMRAEAYVASSNALNRMVKAATNAGETVKNEG